MDKLEEMDGDELMKEEFPVQEEKPSYRIFGGRKIGYSRLRSKHLSATLISFITLFSLWRFFFTESSASPSLPEPRPITTKPKPYPLGPDKEGKYTIASEQLILQFIPYGASISNLFIVLPATFHPSPPESLDPSTFTLGKILDIVAGWDNASYYKEDKLHPHFGGVVGRYANRIRNGSFVVGDGEGGERRVEVDRNEHGGANMLHGGGNGWDFREWEVVNHTPSCIIFKLTDGDGEMGFEGVVESFVTYSVRGRQWDIQMSAKATTKITPIMLSSHTYWNLDGFSNSLTPLILNHTLHLPYASQRIETDSILVPTGKILENEKGGANDFWSVKGGVKLGESLEKDPEGLVGNCGIGCVGYDTCYIHSLRTPPTNLKHPSANSIKKPASLPNVTPPHVSYPRKWWTHEPVAILKSDWSNITMSIYTDQDALQVYDCVGMDGTVPLKKTQGGLRLARGGKEDGDDGSGVRADGRERVIEKYGCVVLEVQDWIDGINHPEWGRSEKQVFGPETGEYELNAVYVFDF